MAQKNKTKLQLAQEEAQAAINEANKRIEVLGGYTNNLYTSLTNIQILFDKIRNVPTKDKLKYNKLKQIRLNWKQQAEKIERDYKEAAAKNAGMGAAGAGMGLAVAAMGPTVAMGIATTFGVASTGTAISTLSGAAATNAALAWLGGGALAAGGGGMAAGQAFLALAGPVGWAIAGVSIVASGLLFWKASSDKKQLEDIFTLISKRDVKYYKLAITEINERITRIKNETATLNNAIREIKTFGLDYDKMTEKQQYALGSYVNLMSSSTQLLVNPILGLQPKYTEEDFNNYLTYINKTVPTSTCKNYKSIIISFANLLYKIKLDDKDKKILWKSFKNNKELLNSLNINKKDFDIIILDATLEALNYKYTKKDISFEKIVKGLKIFADVIKNKYNK